MYAAKSLFWFLKDEMEPRGPLTDHEAFMHEVDPPTTITQLCMWQVFESPTGQYLLVI